MDRDGHEAPDDQPEWQRDENAEPGVGHAGDISAGRAPDR